MKSLILCGLPAMSSVRICRTEDKQDRQYMYNAALGGVRASSVAVQKQKVLHICVYVCV
jgi:hypothetical protein